MARDTRNDFGLLLLRLGYASLLIGFHGWARFFRAFNLVVHHQPWSFVNVVQQMGFPFPVAFAVMSAMAESIAALFVGVGLLTRLAAFIITINMSMAFYHEAAKWSNGGTPELPALYLLGALVILIFGGGRFSLGAMLSGRR